MKFHLGVLFLVAFASAGCVAPGVEPPSQTGAVSAPGDSALSNFYRKIASYRDDLKEPITLVGMGSSVGVGASLPDPATQAPSAWFAQEIEREYNRLGNLNIVHINESENGSVAAQSGTKYADLQARGLRPDVVLMAYGMNDGMSSQYHSSQTLLGVYTYLSAVVNEMKGVGVDVVLTTSPHPHTGRVSWTLPAEFPISYPATGQMIPDATTSQSVIFGDFAGKGTAIEVSYRHYRVNEQIRRVGIDLQVPVIDVEKYWFEAVSQYGQDALFDNDEVVHPNLLGHQQSYQKAIHEFVLGLAQSRGIH